MAHAHLGVFRRVDCAEESGERITCGVHGRFSIILAVEMEVR
jgi:hypothetical protein